MRGCTRSGEARWPVREPIIVIGNGPSATSERVGKEIDAFGTIFRINRFRTIGYEAFVGTRTDIWYTIHGYTNDDERRPEALDEVWMMQTGLKEDEQFILDCAESECRVERAEGRQIMRRYAKGIGFNPERKRSVDGKGNAWVSTGLSCLANLLFVREVPVIWIWGFDGFNLGWHYLTEEDEVVDKMGKRALKTGAYCGHDAYAELGILKTLKKEGRIIDLHDYLDKINPGQGPDSR